VGIPQYIEAPFGERLKRLLAEGQNRVGAPF